MVRVRISQIRFVDVIICSVWIVSVISAVGLIKKCVFFSNHEQMYFSRQIW